MFTDTRLGLSKIPKDEPLRERVLTIVRTMDPGLRTDETIISLFHRLPYSQKKLFGEVSDFVDQMALKVARAEASTGVLYENDKLTQAVINTTKTYVESKTPTVGVAEI